MHLAAFFVMGFKAHRKVSFYLVGRLGWNNDSHNGPSSGSAYVYVLNNGNWSEQQILTDNKGIQYAY